MSTYVIVTSDDKVQSVKRCQLSAFVITWKLLASGCMYSPDCLVGVMTVLVFPVCRCVFILFRYVQLLCVCV